MTEEGSDFAAKVEASAETAAEFSDFQEVSVTSKGNTILKKLRVHFGF